VPKIVEDLAKKIQKTGKSKSAAYAIATSAMQKQGKLKKGTQELTKKGKAYRTKK
jgi:hypothetical protein